ncbi:2-dehydropantoate 2-reductase [Aquirhabdus parva]|nr:2-dehydropantoate 2-reductase [Aquirhabdus parva]
MKICIYGAGAIGCYIGGRLRASGSHVSLIGRARIGDELRQHGLSLSDYRGQRWHVEPNAIVFATDVSAAQDADLVLVTVKSAATAAAAAELADVLKPNAIVISFQNGLSNTDVLHRALPHHTVLEGMVPFNVVHDGHTFHQGSEGELEVREHAGLYAFLADFKRAGLPLIEHFDMLPIQWAKLLLNLNNSINALANLPLKTELSQLDYRRCLALAQREALTLLRAAKIEPAKLTPIPAHWIPRLLNVPDLLFTRLGAKMLTIDPQARSSMSDDLAAGRMTEVDWINGEVVRLAQQLGREAPVNARLIELIHRAERSEIRPSWKGSELLAELLIAGPGTDRL